MGGVHVNDLPFHILETVFSYLDIADLHACALVCRAWNAVISSENSYIWKLAFYQKHSEATKTDILSSVPTYKQKVCSWFHTWNPNDCSKNIFIKPNGFVLHRNPVAQSTDGARGKIGFSAGRHCWEVWWKGPLGTVAMVGVSCKEAVMQCHGYMALLGNDDFSWGWNLVDNTLLHGGENLGSYPQLNNAPRYQVGERITVVLDMDDRMLYFEKGHEFLGVAFRDLPAKKKLFPAISAVYGNTEVAMVYLGPPLDG